MEADIQRKLAQGEGDPEYWEVGHGWKAGVTGPPRPGPLTEALRCWCPNSCSSEGCLLFVLLLILSA
jgi:hypothetical protein